MKKSKMIGLFLTLLILPTFVLASSSNNLQANEFENNSLKNRDWTIVATYPIPESASGLAYDGTNLYCGIYGADGGRIYQIDPSDGSYSLLFTGPQGDAFGLTYDGSYLWTTDHPGSSSIPAVAMQLDMSGNLISQFDLPTHYMSGIAYDEGDFWVAAYYDPNGEIYKVDTLGNIFTQFPAPDNQPWDLCIEYDNLWMADYWGDALYMIDASNGTLLETYPSEGVDPAGIVFDGQYLWYCDNGEGYDVDFLYKIDLGGGGTPEIYVPITNHNFGTVTIGDSATWNAIAENIGTADLVIDNVYFTGYNICVTCPLEFPITINPGNQEEIPFIYTPINPEPLNAIATIQSNDPLHIEVDITLTGNAVNPGPSIYVPVTSHNYGLVRINAITRWFMEIQNIGDSTLVIDSIYCDDTHFIVDSDVSFPININVLDTVQIGIWFNPEEAILYEGTLFIVSNDPGKDPVEVTLEGTGDDSDYEIGETLWQYQITTSWDNSPKAIEHISDINYDDIDDVIICSEDNYIRCFNGNSSGYADILWEKEIYSGNIFSHRGLFITQDVDSDSYKDVVVGTTGGDRSIHTLSGKTGETIWTHDTHEYGSGGWVYQVNCKYDYNSDGVLDVLASTGDDASDTGPKRIYCLDGLTGLSIWECPLGGPGFSVIGIEDCTGDGQPDVLAGASNEYETIGYAYGINGETGTIFWSFDTPGSSVWALAQLDDVNGDRIKDIISGDFSGHYYFIDPTNGDEIYNGYIGTAIILRLDKLDDVNGDGYSDFVIAHSGFHNALVVDGYSGNQIWNHPVADQPWNASRIADVSGDGINDLVVGTLYSNNYAYFLNGVNGSELESIYVGTPVDAIAAIPDIACDGSMEMVVGGRNGWVYCYSGGLDAIVGVDEQSTKVKNSIILQNYPNPFSIYTTISFNLATDLHGSRQIKIYNIKGQLVKTLECGESLSTIAPIHRGYSIYWNGKDFSGKLVSNGVYFYQLETKNFKSEIRKMIILR
ncbi:MAG: PQQ-binding-like beta-propeller repeat protein [Candidatus Cloacimonetes bacterium]|nr:PQQ-binding-like beta-propeller repeat protein [Candidatus Cloacimonadota bacterium]